MLQAMVNTAAQRQPTSPVQCFSFLSNGLHASPHKGPALIMFALQTPVTLASTSSCLGKACQIVVASYTDAPHPNKSCTITCSPAENVRIDARPRTNMPPSSWQILGVPAAQCPSSTLHLSPAMLSTDNLQPCRFPAHWCPAKDRQTPAGPEPARC